MMWCRGFRETIEQIWWLYTWTDSQLKGEQFGTIIRREQLEKFEVNSTPPYPLRKRTKAP
jgi:hypothetical protein